MFRSTIISDAILEHALGVRGSFWGLALKIKQGKRHHATRWCLLPENFQANLLDEGLFGDRRIEQSCFPTLLRFIVIDGTLGR